MKNYYAHPTALVETENVGQNTRIWAFTHVLPGAAIGEDCNLCDHVFIENDVIVGNRVTIKCGVQVWDGITISDDVFIGPNATFTNDPFPRSKQYPASFTKTIIRPNASIGANATILPGLTIGQSAMVGAGSVVTKDVPPFAIVAGNPAQIIGYVKANKNKIRDKISSNEVRREDNSIGVKGVEFHEMPVVEDLRGSLVFSEYGKSLPFVPQRYFLIFNVPTSEVRGEHAHRECHQFLVCVTGACSVVVDDGEKRAEVLLDRPNFGLFIPAMTWTTEYNYSKDAILLVLASDIYKAEDYIRDYDQFIKEIGKK